MEELMDGVVLEPNYDATERVLALSGIQPELCYQCRKCTNGCPLTFAMDHYPDQIVRYLLLGLEEKVLSSSTIWVCSSCETCTTRCPNEIDIAGLMDYLKQQAHAKGFVDARRNLSYAFHKAFLDDIARRGRVFETGLMQRYMLSSGAWKAKLADGTLWDEIRLGVALWHRGRLPLRPRGVRHFAEVRGLFTKPTESNGKTGSSTSSSGLTKE
ncbi:MAG: 4Fe-4S dicluster domain-containing protein [Desulfosoma sp.]|uniref:4Fe-4S dicluster domain-containing protein n=1 Tax=Desulfosoma sp. TaxID=2603217 RepID=UPI0040490F25